MYIKKIAGLDSDSDHHYESITYEESHDDDFDSFESDTESEKSLPKTITLVSYNFFSSTRYFLEMAQLHCSFF